VLVGSTQSPVDAQYSVVPASAWHDTPQVPFTQLPVPIPASGPAHACPQLPQFAGSVSLSTHTPLHAIAVAASQLITGPSPGCPSVGAMESPPPTIIASSDPLSDASSPPSAPWDEEDENALEPQRHNAKLAPSAARTTVVRSVGCINSDEGAGEAPGFATAFPSERLGSDVQPSRAWGAGDAATGYPTSGRGRGEIGRHGSELRGSRAVVRDGDRVAPGTAPAGAAGASRAAAASVATTCRWSSRRAS
jgi:hypothetical protein